MMKKPLLFLLFMLLYVSCHKKNIPDVNKPENDNYSIYIENCLKTISQFNLSEIADSIEYLKLNTPRGIIITSIRRIVYSKPYIFLTSKGIAYQFTTDGNFVRQLGRLGKGPGEYIGVENILVDSVKKEIILCSLFNFLYYSYTGEYIRSKKVLAQASAMLDSTIWIGNPSNGYEKLKLFGINEHLDTIASLKSNDLWKSMNSGRISVTRKSLSPFYYFDSNLYFKGYENSDTIWKINGTAITPYAFIDLGKYKIPFEYRHDYSYENFKKAAKNYYCVPAINEDDKFIFLNFENWDNLLGANILYDKSSDHGYIVKNDNLDGITDDIQNGAPFWPLVINDDYYIGTIEAEDLLNIVDDKLVSQPLKSLLSEINENTNQLLILAKRKKII